MSTKPGLRKHLWTLLKLLIAVGLVGYFIHSGRLDLSLLAKIFRPQYLALGIGLLLVNFLINCYRWMILLKGQNFQLDFMAVLRLNLIGQFFNLAVPGGVGGDLIKGYYLVQGHPERKMAAAVTVLMDRLIGFVTMVMYSCAALMINFDFVWERVNLRPLVFMIFGLLFGFIFLFVTAFSKRLKEQVHKIFALLPSGQHLQNLYDKLYAYRAARKSLVQSLIISICSQSLSITFFILVGHALGMPQVGWEAYFFVVPLGMIIMAIPIAPAGIGVGQYAYFLFFNWYLGYESQLGTTSVTAFQIISILLGLPGALIYFTRPHLKVSQMAEAISHE